MRVVDGWLINCCCSASFFAVARLRGCRLIIALVEYRRSRVPYCFLRVAVSSAGIAVVLDETTDGVCLLRRLAPLPGHRAAQGGAASVPFNAGFLRHERAAVGTCAHIVCGFCAMHYLLQLRHSQPQAHIKGIFGVTVSE